ncbi:hypothetical protein GPX89_09150 [Nocardia sp. ET3-3]|uniref:Uncharacterized protein n=1 Tax=Nocardia terrae TaxID=2675851 RepID=A0A7K1UST5_9NOCA|nr:hypothetical protein [Nocardia terrae]
MLWIGDDAYPLQNIARVGPRELVPPPPTPVKDYLKLIAAAVIPALIVGLLFSSGLGWFVFLVVFGVATYRLIRVLTEEKTRLYALTIETAGASNTVLVSSDIETMVDIAQNIMKAIDDPQFEFARNITVDARGANIGQIGDHGQHMNSFGVPPTHS